VADLTSVLPHPQGSPEQLREAARTWGLVAAGAGSARIAGPGVPAVLGRVWAGEAADAAVSEAAAAGRALSSVTDCLGRVAGIVLGHADETAAARSAVDRLRERWRAGELAHRSAQRAGDVAALVDADRAWATMQRRLRDEHTAVLRQQGVADARTAAALGATIDGLVASCGSRPGTPVVDALLGGLSLTDGARRSSAARAQVEALLLRVGPLREAGVRSLAPLLDLDPDDPLVAQALLDALGPEALAMLVTRIEVVRSGSPDPTARADATRLLTLLGVALLTATDPRAASGLSPADQQRLVQWRARSLTTLAGTARRRYSVGVSEVRGADVLALLLRAARTSRPGLPPSLGLALTALGMATDDGPATPTSAPAIDVGPAVDPSARIDLLSELLCSLRADYTRANEVLLAPTASSRSVLQMIVASSRAGADAQRAQALRELLDVLTAGEDESAARTSAELLTALCAAAPPTRAMLEALVPLSAELLGRFADQLGVTLLRPDGSPGGAAVPTASGWTVSLPDRAGVLRLVERIAAGGVQPGVVGSEPLGEPMVTLLGRLTAAETARLSTAMAAADPLARSAAVRRFAQIIGFVTVVTARAVIAVHAGSDLSNAQRAELAKQLLGSVNLAAVLGKALPHLPTKIVGLLSGFIVTQLGTAVDAVLPTDAASRARSGLGSDGERRVEAARTLVWDLASRFGSWPATADPTAWAHANGTARFTGADGRPLPWGELSPTQREAMAQWAAGVPEYQNLVGQLLTSLGEGERMAGRAG